MCPGKYSEVPLYHAATLGLRDLAEHLIDKHPEYVDARGGMDRTPTCAAAFEGHADILSLLLDHGANLGARGVNGWTPLHITSTHGKEEADRTLLGGADINSCDDIDETPLFWAVIAKRVEFVRMLLERGAMVDVRNDHNRTPLHFAVSRYVRMLLEHGADVNARDNSGNTPSHLVSALRDPGIGGLLSEYGAESIK